MCIDCYLSIKTFHDYKVGEVMFFLCKTGKNILLICN